MLKHFLEDGCWLSFAAHSEIRVNSVCVFGASDHASCSSVFQGWGAFPPTNVP